MEIHVVVFSEDSELKSARLEFPAKFGWKEQEDTWYRKTEHALMKARVFYRIVQ